MPELRHLLVGDPPEAWSAAGFAVTGDQTSIGSVGIKFVPDSGPGVVGWEVTEIEDSSIDGIMSIATEDEPVTPIEHPNGASRLDHVVVMTPDIERTTTSLSEVGFSARRTRDLPGSEPPRRQVFLWAGEAILEVVGPVNGKSSDPASIWGLALTTDRMDDACQLLGANITEPKPAVQPGRMIATIATNELGISPALALMTPHTSAGDEN